MRSRALAGRDEIGFRCLVRGTFIRESRIPFDRSCPHIWDLDDRIIIYVSIQLCRFNISLPAIPVLPPVIYGSVSHIQIVLSSSSELAPQNNAGLDDLASEQRLELLHVGVFLTGVVRSSMFTRQGPLVRSRGHPPGFPAFPYASSFFHKQAPLAALSMSSSCCAWAASSSDVARSTINSSFSSANAPSRAGENDSPRSISRLSWPRVIAR